VAQQVIQFDEAIEMDERIGGPRQPPYKQRLRGSQTHQRRRADRQAF
jgi:hypothetical protein